MPLPPGLAAALRLFQQCRPWQGELGGGGGGVGRRGDNRHYLCLRKKTPAERFTLPDEANPNLEVLRGLHVITARV